MIRILFTTPELQHPPRGGPKLRIENSIKALRQLSDLVIVSRVPADRMGGDRAIAFYQNYCRKFLLMPDMPPEVAAQGLMELARAEQSEVLWLGYGNVSYEILHHLKGLGFSLPVVVDTDSVWSRFVLRGLPYKPTFEDRLKALASGWFKRWEEYWGTRAAHVTTAVSPFDAEYYKVLTARPGSVEVFSNVLDLDNYSGAHPNPGMKKPCIYLAGTFGPNSPMEESALWIMEEVLPLARRTYPELHFYVVGVGATDKMKARADHGVTITGALDSVLPYLANADVSVVPLKYESGTRFKIMEAAACRVPIVSTTLGAEGIPVTHGKDILIADSPADFARSIVELVRNPQRGRELADNCYRLIERDCSVSTAVSQADGILESIRSGKCHPPGAIESDSQLISSLAYRLNRSSQFDDRLAAGLLLFIHLMKAAGANPTFVETEELLEAQKLLEEAARQLPPSQSLNEARQIAAASLRGMERQQPARRKVPAAPVASVAPSSVSRAFSTAPGVDVPNGYRTLLAEAERLLQCNRPEAALAVANQALSVSPGVAGTQFLRFRCLNRLGRSLEALRSALTELSLRASDVTVLTDILGELKVTDEDLQSSPTEFLRSLDDLLTHIHRHHLQVRGIQRARALCLLKTSRLSEALSALRAERVLSPQDPDLRALMIRVQEAQVFESQLLQV